MELTDTQQPVDAEQLRRSKNKGSTSRICSSQIVRPVKPNALMFLNMDLELFVYLFVCFFCF